jgi:hypothetical protein
MHEVTVTPNEGSLLAAQANIDEIPALARQANEFAVRHQHTGWLHPDMTSPDRKPLPAASLTLS